KTQKMCIQPAPANLISSWLRDCGFSEAGQQWPDDHDRTAKPPSFFLKFFRLEVIDINIFSFKRIRIFIDPLHRYHQSNEQVNQLVYVIYIRDIADNNLLFRTQYSRQNLQSLVLRPLRYNFPL